MENAKIKKFKCDIFSIFKQCEMEFLCNKARGACVQKSSALLYLSQPLKLECVVNKFHQFFSHQLLHCAAAFF